MYKFIVCNKGVDGVCLKLWYERYFNYYKYSLSDSFLKSKIKRIIKKILSRKKEDQSKNLLVLHNIMIDSHRFVAQKALSLISQANQYKKD